MTHALSDYASRNELNRIIAKNMLYVTQLQEGTVNFKKKASFCFTTAYEICHDMIENSPIPLEEIPDYFRRARHWLITDEDQTTIIKAVTMSIVHILASHFDPKWREDNEEALSAINSMIWSLRLKGENEEKLLFEPKIRRMMAFSSICGNIYHALSVGTDIPDIVPFEEFNQAIHQETALESIQQASRSAHAQLLQALNFPVGCQQVANSAKAGTPAKQETADPADSVATTNTPVADVSTSDHERQLAEQLKEANEKISKLEKEIADYESIFGKNPKDENGNKIPILTGKQHVILMLAFLAEHNRIPATRTNISYEMSMIAQRAEGTMFDYLKDRINQDECDKLSKMFETNLPFIATIIKRLPDKLKEDISEKNREKRVKIQ